MRRATSAHGGAQPQRGRPSLRPNRAPRIAAGGAWLLTAVLAACSGSNHEEQLGRAAVRTRATVEARAPEGRAAPSLAQAPDQFLERDDVTIRYRMIGEGEPLLLLHGYTHRLEMWAGTADSLALHFRVVVPDIRGFGRSLPRSRSGPFGRAMVDDLVALLDELAIHRVHIAGYSMGGLLAAQLALRDPRRVASATLIAGAFWDDSATTTRELAPYIAAIPTEAGLIPFFRRILPTWPDSMLEDAARHYLADNDRSALVASAKSLAALALDWGRVAQLRVPAVAIVGDQDGIRDHTRRMAARWPGISLVEIPGGDHANITLLPLTLQAIRRSATGAAATAARLVRMTHAGVQRASDATAGGAVPPSPSLLR